MARWRRLALGRLDAGTRDDVVAHVQDAVAAALDGCFPATEGYARNQFRVTRGRGFGLRIAVARRGDIVAIGVLDDVPWFHSFLRVPLALATLIGVGGGAIVAVVALVSSGHVRQAIAGGFVGGAALALAIAAATLVVALPLKLVASARMGAAVRRTVAQLDEEMRKFAGIPDLPPPRATLSPVTRDALVLVATLGVAFALILGVVKADSMPLVIVGGFVVAVLAFVALGALLKLVIDLFA